jgi:hypothetical protein
MERENKVSMDSSTNDFVFDARNKFTFELKKQNTSDMLKKKRMRIINSTGNLEDEMKEERETYKRFENYLKLFGSLNDGEPEITDDRSLNINASHLQTLSHILENYGSNTFTHQVVNLGAHKALNLYIQAYTFNRNNPDLEGSCVAVLNILEICTRDDLKIVYALERDIKYFDCLLNILKGDIRSLELVTKLFDCLSNLISLGFLRERFSQENTINHIANHIQNIFDKPTGTPEHIEHMVNIGMWCIAKLVPPKDELEDTNKEADLLQAGMVAVKYFKLNMQEPLVWVYEILTKFYSHFETETLVNDDYLPPDLIEYSFKLYMDKDAKINLKIKILNTLTALLSVDFMEQHLNFANKDFYVCLKYDFLNEHIEESKLSLHNTFFCSIANLLKALFEFNDSETNESICEDLEFEKLFLEFLVNNKRKSSLLFYIYKLMLATAMYTSLPNVRRMLMMKDDFQVFVILFDSIRELEADEQEVIQTGLECVDAILELETLETSESDKLVLREKVALDSNYMSYLEAQSDKDTIDTLQLKEKILERVKPSS